MINFWKWLIGGDPCEHQWDIVEKIKVMRDEKETIPLYYKFVLRCKKCGDIRVRKT